MELFAGYPYWLMKAGLPYQYPKLTKNMECQVLVLGGGISGALAAYEFVSAGLDTILIDGRTIGLGSTSASTSILQYELDVPLHRLEKIVGEHNARRAYQVCGQAVDGLVALMLDTGFKVFTKAESLFFSIHGKEIKMLQKECTARRASGFDVEFLNNEQVAERFGVTASAGIASSKAAINNAYLLTHHLLQNSMKRGLRVFDRTKAISIREKKGTVMIETANGMAIRAGNVLNASGYEVVNFIKKKIVDLDCTYAIASETREDWDPGKNKAVMWSTDDPYLYLCETNDGRLMIGGRDERFVNFKSLHRDLEKKAAALEKDFEKLFPGETFRREFSWSGVFGKTKDSLPYIGRLNNDSNIYYALGFGGNGITFSFAAAKIVVDLIRGIANEDANIFSFHRRSH
ncbi:MAG TPA: FAD-binding oxidoreductase [Chitinophagaceae bacterium]